MTEFDFDNWASLFKADPDAFQERKYALLNEIIAKSSQDIRPKLEHTLFRIRMSEQRAKNPLQSAMESSKLMWECFEKMRSELEVLENSFDSEAMQEAAKNLLCPEQKTTPKKAKSPKTKTSSQASISIDTAKKIKKLRTAKKPLETKPSAKVLLFPAQKN